MDGGFSYASYNSQFNYPGHARLARCMRCRFQCTREFEGIQEDRIQIEEFRSALDKYALLIPHLPKLKRKRSDLQNCVLYTNLESEMAQTKSEPDRKYET